MTKKAASTKKSSSTEKTEVPASAPTAETSARSNKIAKTQIADLVATKTGLTKKQAGEALDAFMEVVVTGIQQGQSVGLPGLGTFSVRATAARTGVRPGTSERIQIPAGKKVAFKVASTLKGSLTE